MLHPSDLENRINALEKKFTEKVFHFSGRAYLLFFFFFVFALTCYSVFLKIELPEWMRFQLVSARFYGALLLAIGGLVLPMISTHRLPVFFYGLATLVWLASLGSLSLAAVIPPLFLLINFAVNHVLRGFKISNKIQTFLLLLSTIILFVVMISAISGLGIHSSDYSVFKYFWLLHLEMLLLYFLKTGLAREKAQPLVALNPLQLWFPMPWSSEMYWETKTESRQLLYYQGWLQLGFSLFGITLLIGTYWIFTPSLPAEWSESPFAQSLGHYLHFIIIITFGSGVISGFLKIFGFQKSDINHFLILSKSPLEIWQRGNRPMANFLFELVYLPIFRITRSAGLSLLAIAMTIFLNLYLLPEVILRKILKITNPQIALSDIDVQKAFVSPLTWILLWILWILIFEKTNRLLRQRFLFAQKPLYAWSSIIVTHLVASQIIPLTRYFIQIVRESFL